MGNELSNSEAPKEDEVAAGTKMLGAHVDSDIYWKFKAAAAERKEDLKIAINHAAQLYIDITKGG